MGCPTRALPPRPHQLETSLHTDVGVVDSPVDCQLHVFVLQMLPADSKHSMEQRSSPRLGRISRRSVLPLLPL